MLPRPISVEKYFDRKSNTTNLLPSRSFQIGFGWQNSSNKKSKRKIQKTNDISTCHVQSIDGIPQGVKIFFQFVTYPGEGKCALGAN
jgi:hypothetical protein